MPRSVVSRASFAGGQIDTAQRRDPATALFAAGLNKGQNLRILNGGGVKRRAGSWLRAKLSNGKAVGGEYTAGNGTVYILVFSHTQLDVYSTAGALLQTVTGCAWGSSIIDDMQFARSYDDLVIAHTTFFPQVVSISTGTWTVANFAFDAAPGGGLSQPYYRYAAKGITLGVDALTGAVNLTTSANVFQAGHISAYFRYLGYEILITGVTNGTTAQGTVVNTLPSTVNVTVADATGYLANASVQGLDSGAKGIITNVAGPVLTIVYESGLTGFTSTDTLVADGGAQSTVVAGPAPTTPAAVLDWDEQAFSLVRGYPGGVAVHRGRLYYCNMRDVPRGVTGSAAGFPNDFRVGANDGDAFFELVPDYKGQRVLHVVTASQGLVLTDKCAYFLPEYGTQVITPSTIDFRLIDTIGASKVKPVPTEQGFAYVEQGTNRIIGILPSGNVYSPWECDDISAFWSEQMTGPRALSADIAITSRPERYAYVLNDDGTIACLKYESPSAQVPIGWLPWQTAGAFRSLFPAGGKTFAITQRSFNGVETWLLEELDEALYLDACISFTTGSAPIATFASMTISVMSDGSWYRGDFALNSSGNFGTDFTLDDGIYVAGLGADVTFEPTTPIPDHPAYSHGQTISIPRVYLHVKDTGIYYLNEQLSPAYRMGEDTDAAPPLRTEGKRWKVPGRGPQITPSVLQMAPQPLHILALTAEVGF